MQRPPPTIGDLVRSAFDRRRIALPVAAAVFAVGLYVALTRVPMYEASARLVATEPQHTVNFAHDGAELREFSLINTYRELLLLPGVLREAVIKAGLAESAPYAGATDTSEILVRRLRITVNRDNWLIAIALRDEQPQRAERLLRGLIDVFLDRLRQQRQGRSSESLEFLVKQEAEARSRLAEAQARELDFRRATGVISSDPKDNHVYLRLSDLSRQRADLERHRVESQALADQVREAARTPDVEHRRQMLLGLPAFAVNLVVADHLKVLKMLTDEEARLGEKYLDRHPRMIEVKAQRAQRLASLDESIEQVRQGVLAGQTQVERQIADQDALVAEAENAARIYRDNLAKLGSLEAESRSREEVLKHLAGRLAEQEVTRNLQDNQISEIDPPAAGPRAVGLPSALYACFALFGAALAGLAAAFVADALDRRVRGAALLPALAGGKPLLVSVARSPNPPEVGGTLPDDFAEAIRTLRTAVRFALPRKVGTASVVVFAGAAPAVGTSTIAAQFAVAVALAGERVLLVDAQLRAPVQRRLFAVGAPAGFAALLAGEPDILPVATAIPNLDLLDVDAPQANAAELLNSHCLPEWLAYVRPLYDVIVFDAPDLAGQVDALALGQHADGILLLVRDHLTLITEVESAVTSLAPLAGIFIGTVLTDAQ